MSYVALVIYDIKDDRLRFEIANFLRQVGLSRIQKSAFAGPIKPSLKSEIEAGIRRIVKEWGNYNIQIYVMTSATYSNRTVISSGYTIEDDDKILLI